MKEKIKIIGVIAGLVVTGTILLTMFVGSVAMLIAMAHVLMGVI